MLCISSWMICVSESLSQIFPSRVIRVSLRSFNIFSSVVIRIIHTVTIRGVASFFIYIFHRHDFSVCRPANHVFHFRRLSICVCQIFLAHLCLKSLHFAPNYHPRYCPDRVRIRLSRLFLILIHSNIHSPHNASDQGLALLSPVVTIFIRNSQGFFGPFFDLLHKTMFSLEFLAVTCSHSFASFFLEDL